MEGWTVPRLTGDLSDQDATRGGGGSSEYQIPLHHVKKRVNA